VAKNKLNLSLDLRIVSGVLLAIIVVMLALWMPWESSEKSDEVIKVTGETVLKAEPDQFVFYPSYPFKSKDKADASSQATAKGNEISAKLKELGVSDSDIKLAVDGYMGRPFPDNGVDEYTYTAQLTITVDNREKAQEIQDYLTTTQPQGSVTPQATFSEEKRIELEAQARDQATQDARNKADQSAKNLGFKLGRVKSVEDGTGFNDGGPITLEGRGTAVAMDSASSKLPVQPGENEIRYSVTVTYFVR
jgi:uncharacterized protein